MTIRFYQIREIAAGDAVTLTLFNDAYCGSFLEIPCRRLRVRSATSGTLTVRVAPDDFKLAPVGASGYQPLESSLSVRVGPQSETEFDVWGSSSWDGQGTGRAFTLTSSVE